MDKKEVIDYIQSVINTEYAGLQVAFAQYNNISAAYLNDVLKGRKDPGKKILDAVGVERVVIYKLKQ